jgi:hypothetical protein
MIDEYIQLLLRICTQPCIAEEPIEEECSLLHAGKMNVQDWKRALRSMRVQSYLSNHSTQAPIISRQTMRPTTHHAVHQAILWMNTKISPFATQTQKEQLRRIRTRMGWGTLSPAPPSNSALMILFNHPLYAAAYKKGREIVHAFAT